MATLSKFSDLYKFAMNVIPCSFTTAQLKLEAVISGFRDPTSKFQGLGLATAASLLNVMGMTGHASSPELHANTVNVEIFVGD